MILDGHIHIMDYDNNQEDFLKRLKTAGIDGGIVISLPPPCFKGYQTYKTYVERIDHLFEFCSNTENIYPFYWIDPLEKDAKKQIDYAIEKGVMGFKVICDYFFPGDETAMKTYSYIAEQNFPILFHSGILWDGKPSSNYNRPLEFEPLLKIKGLRFSLAHISWPWCDELIAVYGKFLNAQTKNIYDSVEMFIDLTPGTPSIYRKDALTKLFTVGYDIENNIIFGTDCNADEYNSEWAKEWMNRDNQIYEDLNLSKETVNKIYSENLKRFLGISKETVTKKLPKQGE